MKKLFSIVLLGMIIFGGAVPALAQPSDPFAGKGLIPCGNPGQEMCEFKHVMILINDLMKFLIWLSIPIAVIAFTYSGFLFMTAGGNPGQLDKAKGIFRNVAIGLVFVISAWLIVYLIVSNLVEDEIIRLFF